jgi:7-cyano-7-deazaguanine synthase
MAKTAVILLSGGLDSGVNLAIGVNKYNLKLALHFNYGQKCAVRELAGARKLCRYYKIPLKVIVLPWLKAINSCSLVSEKSRIPKFSFENLEQTEAQQVQGVWITNRNGLFINIAACFAESLKADYILAGFNAEEAQSFPDNSADFVKAVNKSLKFSTSTDIKLKALTQNMTKVEMVRTGFKLKFPFKLIWSCYAGGETMCGVCSSCLRLRRGIKEAGLEEAIDLQFISAEYREPSAEENF